MRIRAIAGVFTSSLLLVLTCSGVICILAVSSVRITWTCASPRVRSRLRRQVEGKLESSISFRVFIHKDVRFTAYRSMQPSAAVHDSSAYSGSIATALTRDITSRRWGHLWSAWDGAFAKIASLPVTQLYSCLKWAPLRLAAEEERGILCVS